MTDDSATLQRNTGRYLGYFAGAMLVIALYVLSAAPALRLVCGADQTVSVGPIGVGGLAVDTFPNRRTKFLSGWEAIYAPVLRLMEIQPLRPPMGAWFQQWSVERRVEWILLERFFECEPSIQ